MTHISRTLLLVLAVVAASPDYVGATTEPPNKCGNIESPAELLADAYAPAFYEPESARWRSTLGVQTLADGTAGEVVTDQAVCRRVMHEAMRIFRSWPDWREISRNGYEFQVYRIGPYYGVHHRSLPPEGVLRLTFISTLLVFRADTLDYIGALGYRL